MSNSNTLNLNQSPNIIIFMFEQFDLHAYHHASQVFAIASSKQIANFQHFQVSHLNMQEVGGVADVDQDRDMKHYFDTFIHKKGRGQQEDLRSSVDKVRAEK